MSDAVERFEIRVPDPVLASRAAFESDETGYQRIQGTRPQTTVAEIRAFFRDLRTGDLA